MHVATGKPAAKFQQGDSIGDTDITILHISAMNAVGERIILAEQPLETETYGDENKEYNYSTWYMSKEGTAKYRHVFEGDDEGAATSVADFEMRCTQHRVSMPLILG